MKKQIVLSLIAAFLTGMLSVSCAPQGKKTEECEKKTECTARVDSCDKVENSQKCCKSKEDSLKCKEHVQEQAEVKEHVHGEDCQH